MGFLLTDFVGDNLGWTFNFVMSQILFWVWAFPALNDYGYDDSNKSPSGSIESGPSGSGVGIISSMLMVVALLTWFGKLMSYTPKTA
mmetsp:Transcript_14942/g.30744  ORF Transcript_14942/g.30744 Transcript_14942/m.30744 type:complete len:87 (+) Transcript_14942:39-299(+)|eukprot:CAMPEP_0118661822 /NCGR_PEP_ID=MMETSP0785-20121206/16494_1 /TAXON_ID=91992 /ORGANISM="Bolidomonas pacifica, Strain CCMP 1866" /LENGTH=86 /DNA_ID=CAMNT_0006555307 /DNA_START=26 /DNA_END=286 /DNA_ORIENTATION=-